MKCISLLCEFSVSNPQYRVAYRTRVDRKDLKRHGKRIQRNAAEIDEMLIKSRVMVSDDMMKDSYMEVFKSNVVLFYTSTLGYESLGMDKRVINLNLDKLTMGLSTEDEIGTLINYNYLDFERKIKYLLDAVGDEVETYYRMKKAEYMNVDKNIVDTIVRTISYEVSRGVPVPPF